MNFKIKIYIDGASRGNPGHAAIGAVFMDEQNKILNKFHKYLGIRTNNFAEYSALVFALEEAKKIGYKNIEVRSDSELLIKQINGEYSVKSLDLKPLYLNVKKLLNDFNNYKFFHIPRTLNKVADKLANIALDLNGSGIKTESNNQLFKINYTDVQERKIRKRIKLSKVD
ncbi:MAG: ribonuclease HI family protein [Candidatus Firestonebacteria bacterium]|nr:ribonuclease HI family protein [Candidatus Firestonebacteria bacterium]